jgi:aspartate beta-hydroxylase
MTIGETLVTWKEGDVVVFDDSFEHEVWNNSSEDRMIFILDIFHPDLTKSQKKEDLFNIIL